MLKRPMLNSSEITWQYSILKWNAFKSELTNNSDFTSHSAYVATSTESDGAKINGFLDPNFM